MVAFLVVIVMLVRMVVVAIFFITIYCVYDRAIKQREEVKRFPGSDERLCLRGHGGQKRFGATDLIGILFDAVEQDHVRASDLIPIESPKIV